MAEGQIKQAQVKIDKVGFENLCELQCTKLEIASFFDVSEKTLSRWCEETYDTDFVDIYKKKSAGGKMSLRRTQFRLAEKSPVMAIWLGKQYLGQRDNFEDENKDENKVTIIDDISGDVNESSKIE